MGAYEDTIAYLAGLEVSVGWDLKLERMREALARRGHPEAAFPALHVAGTNGKGSTAAMLDAVLRATGATRVVVFDHNVRCRPMAKRGENGAGEPVKFAHNDYTFKSAPQRVRDLLPGAEAKALLEHRYAVINVWRPIRGPVEESPLAVCDARSMELRDFVASDLRYRDRTGEVYSVAYNSKHRWFYFPRMQREEALLLKCFDSADDGRARFTAHTAFEDPTSRPGAVPREGIAAFLAGANPNWSRDALVNMLNEHLSLTTEEALARIQKRWTDDTVAFDRILTQALMMADALTDGIVKQFPSKV